MMYEILFSNQFKRLRIVAYVTILIFVTPHRSLLSVGELKNSVRKNIRVIREISGLIIYYTRMMCFF